jgi:two-component system sensor histidine kinase ChiS
MEALAIINAGYQPDLVLLDVMMPRITGYEVCRRLRLRFPANELPIIMLSAKNQVTDLVEGLEAGANDYLTKPISKHELRARIKMHLQLSQLNLAYSRFVPNQFLNLLNKDDIINIKLGDQIQKEMSLLFCNIHSFTTLSENMSSEDNFKFLNTYLSYLEPAINQHQGFIDKYLGDEVIALFSRCADDALKAGIEIVYQIRKYNEQRQFTGSLPIQLGISITTGFLMLGTIGNSKTMAATVISEAINLAPRLENLTQQYAISLIISEKTYLKLNDPSAYAIRKIDSLKVNNQPITVYEVFETDELASKQAKLATKDIFAKAITSYEQEQFDAAAKLFAECLHHLPSDTTAQVYLQRCQRLNVRNSG